MAKGIKQRLLGDKFEDDVNERIMKNPESLGLFPRTPEVVFSCRTEGSRGEADIVTFLSDGGDYKVALTQAKRNNHLPASDRKKLSAILKSSGQSSFVHLFLAGYVTPKDWDFTLLTKDDDLINTKRMRQFDKTEYAELHQNDRQRADAEFEMDVVNAIKKNFNTIFCQFSPEMKTLVPFFTIRLEERPGDPGIVSVCRDTDTGKNHLLCVYPCRTGLLPEDCRDGANRMMDISLNVADNLIRVYVAHYVTGKQWKMQEIVAESELRRFYYV